jgi:uncharacterized membrane protein
MENELDTNISIKKDGENIPQKIFVNEDNRIETYYYLLQDIPSKQRIKIIKDILSTESEIEDKKHKKYLKYLIGFVSMSFILMPHMFFDMDLFTKIGISSLGAVGYGALLFDILGENAFEAGKSLRDVFNKDEKK